MAEFLKMILHLKWLSNSELINLNLNLIWIQLQICFSEGSVLTHPKHSWPRFCKQLTASSKAAARLALDGERTALLWRQRVLQRTAEPGGRGGHFKHTMDITSVEICWDCLSALKETLETLKLRDYQRDQPQAQRHYPAAQLDAQKAFKQEKADVSSTMHYSECRPINGMGDSVEKIQLKNAFYPAVNCCIMPTDQSRSQVNT